LDITTKRHAINHFLSLLSNYRVRKRIPKDTISKGRIKVVCSGYGVRLYWDALEVTQGAGLNSGINTLGLWTDSSFAEWQILEKDSDYFILKAVFKNLPISQIWKIKIDNEQTITWHVEMHVEEEIHVDEACIVCLVSPDYKAWVNNYKQGYFPRLRQGTAG